MKITTYEIHDSKTTDRIGEIYALPSDAKKIKALSDQNAAGDFATSELVDLDCVTRGLLEKLAGIKTIYCIEV